MIGIKEVVSEKKGSQIARRKKHSTLTAGTYYPRPEAATAGYYGVFVNGEPYLLFHCGYDKDARGRANNIAASANFRTLLEATGTLCERIEAGYLEGNEVDWSRGHTVISASRSGDVETATREISAIRAIVMYGSHSAVAETFCIDAALASLIDTGFPRVSNFDDLPELTDHDVKLSLGNLEARKHPRGGH
ncbi:hypothetical protein KEHDKFFH_11080 [Marinobacter maroccanus]|uniref:Uncharacterized protein n=1 Tax=Marinobacter maroccanus TaxID=2055143 RepID=A0A2S5Z9V4_9GAMM|nr:hypothetical protein KEHDKFFH_11080 [Marinobacter maroccanus]